MFLKKKIISFTISNREETLVKYVPCHEQNLSSGSSTKSDTNRAVQPQKMVRGLQSRIRKVDGLLCLNVTKGSKQLWRL